MLHQLRHRNIRLSLIPLFLCCLFFTQSAHAAPDKPTNVSALIYSSSALEIFWTPAAGTIVEITRNGEELGRKDARSLFQPGLSSSRTYLYVLRSVANDGTRSEPVVLSATTQNFEPPIKRVYSVGSDLQVDTASPPPPEPVEIAASVTNSVVADSAADGNAQNQTTAIVQGDNNCLAGSVNGLLSCVRNAGNVQRIDITQDIQCDNNCCPSGQALLNLNGVNGLELNGHGHRLLRSQNQRQCSLLDIANSSSVSVNNIFLDDDISVGGCQVSDRCARMVHVRNSNNINFSQTHVSHGKGYSFYVNGTNGFKFQNGSLHNSGVLGMYVGHGNTPSTNINITDSTFSDNQTNGLALLGVVGNSVDDNVVANNLFVRNHRKGQFEVAPRFGTGFTGGGQVYIAEVSNVTVRNNIVRDGFCDNCFVQRVARSGISGIEIGLPNKASIRNLQVNDNLVLNHDGFAISQNSNSNLNNVNVRNNVLLNSTNGLHIEGAQLSGNRVIDTQRFDSFESGNTIGSDYTGNVQCSSGAVVQRQCGLGSRFGQCAAELRLGSADCGNAQVELTSSSVSISGGQSIVADGWVNNPIGQWCVDFLDDSGNRISTQCRSLSNSDTSDVDSFVGLPQIDAQAPSTSRAAKVRLVHQQAGERMLVDDLKISVQ